MTAKESRAASSPSRRFAGSTIARPAESAANPRLGLPLVVDVESYHKAWQKLMPPSDELAGPLLYLQRHAFELLVKEVLMGVLEFRKQTHDLDELLGKAGPGPVAPEDVAKANRTHSFEDLFPRLEDNLQSLDFPQLPEHFDKLRQLFVGVDEDRPDRLRYDVQFDKKKKTVAPSFPRDKRSPFKVAPCNEVAELLSSIMEARNRQLEVHVNGREVTEDSALDKFYSHYWHAWRCWEHEIGWRLKKLVVATETRAISWQEAPLTSSETAKQHVFVTDAEYFDEVFLEAAYQNRNLILGIPKEIVTRRKLLSDDSLCLAARKADGTLSPGVWFDGYQSELGRKIILALNTDTCAEDANGSPQPSSDPPPADSEPT